MGALADLWRRAWPWLSGAVAMAPSGVVAPAQSPPPRHDVKRLVADLRKRDPAALERAYDLTFGGDVGRMVLLQHLIDCGVGEVFGPDLTDAQLRYAAGRHDAALMLANHVFDAASIVAALDSELQGKLNDEAAHHPETRPAAGSSAGWDDDDEG